MPNLWLLTSSGGSAQFAAHFGMALSFAQFINPEGGPDVADFYRHNFKPSEHLQKPELNVGIFAFCSEDEQKVRDWKIEFDYRMLHIESGARGEIPSFEEIKNISYNLQQRARIAYNEGRYIAGTPDVVEKAFRRISENYETDEIMVATVAENYSDRKTSYELLANIFPQ